MRNRGYEPGGYYGIPEPFPERTDPQLGLTGRDVVAKLLQDMETTGQTPVITPETLDEAARFADLMLAALGAAPVRGSDR